ncbi:MAG TPA: Uma2 family endonuclease, partial [Chloroflexota bacterium]
EAEQRRAERETSRAEEERVRANQAVEHARQETERAEREAMARRTAEAELARLRALLESRSDSEDDAPSR